jgi:molybdenum cofactor biosynthesis enzyme MoaA
VIERLYHVTVLSNFARGFDKYSNSYCKERIPESTFPNRFFLLLRNELGIGIQKAEPLLDKLALEGNRLIVLETEADASELQPNTANGRGQFIHSNRIRLTGVHELESQTGEPVRLRPLATEDAMAASLRMLSNTFVPFNDIRPRAISFLPVALACQAKCPFCFSKASVSSDQSVAKPDWEKIGAWLDRARARRAERAVITGGGEPTLLREPMLSQLVWACAQKFEKIVLITNGHTLSSPDTDPGAKLDALYSAGLSVLAISRHHQDTERCRQLMHLDTPIENLIQAWRMNRRRRPHLRLRLICVLQKGGVEDTLDLERYISWATAQGIEEICFKELYVSTSAESVYHDRAANDWSRNHQVPLSLVTSFAERKGFVMESRLPWGAPVYRGQWLGKIIRVAAYTEPTLFWERTQGIARSWNIMADGRCHVSLEDRASEIKLEEAA